MITYFFSLFVIHISVVSQFFPQLKTSVNFVVMNGIIYFNKNANTYLKMNGTVLQIIYEWLNMTKQGKSDEMRQNGCYIH